MIKCNWISGIFLCIIFLQSGFAQTGGQEEAVKKLFDKPGKIKWIQHYQGRIDDINDIALSLAYDGKHCRGLLTYLRSKEIFTLDGKLDDGQLRLEERYGPEIPSGHIRARIESWGIYGEWTNHDGTISGQLNLRPVRQAVEFPTHCGDNKWIHIYNGAITPYATTMIIQKDSDQSLRGSVYISKENKTYQASGRIEAAGDFHLYLRNADGQPKGTLHGEWQKERPVNVFFITPSGHKRPAIFKIEEVLSVGCMEFADFLSSYDITFPKTKSVAFNRWIGEQSAEWANVCRAYAAEVRKLNPEMSSNLRSSVRSFAWSEIDYYSDQLISGSLTFSNTWQTDMEGLFFNFDMISGKPITQQDIFGPEFDPAHLAKQLLKQDLKDRPYAEDPDFKKWFDQVRLDKFTIRHEGLCFTTGFHSIYGRQQIVIPYALLKKYMPEQNPVAHLYE